MKSWCPENDAKATNASARRTTWNWKENLKWCDMKPVQLKPVVLEWSSWCSLTWKSFNNVKVEEGRCQQDPSMLPMNAATEQHPSNLWNQIPKYTATEQPPSSLWNQIPEYTATEQNPSSLWNLIPKHTATEQHPSSLWNQIPKYTVTEQNP